MFEFLHNVNYGTLPQWGTLLLAGWVAIRISKRNNDLKEYEITHAKQKNLEKDANVALNAYDGLKRSLEWSVEANQNITNQEIDAHLKKLAQVRENLPFPIFEEKESFLFLEKYLMILKSIRSKTERTFMINHIISMIPALIEGLINKTKTIYVKRY